MSAKGTQGGMQGLAFAPFPFLNPWNWGAMTPVNGMQAAFAIARANLTAWRCFCDASLAMLRQQDDAALDAVAHALEQPPAAKPASGRRAH